jgi:hypothetical protein
MYIIAELTAAQVSRSVAPHATRSRSRPEYGSISTTIRLIVDARRLATADTLPLDESSRFQVEKSFGPLISTDALIPKLPRN